MSFLIILKRKFRQIDIKTLLLWIILLVIVIWFLNCKFFTSNEDLQIEYKKLIDTANLNDNPLSVHIQDEDKFKKNEFEFQYNRQLPIIFVGGVPRSGTTLMRAMLDAHPLIRCGEETRIVPRVIYLRNQWTSNKRESERLKSAGITEDIIDSAVASFILEVIVRHGKPANRLCNKDPLVLRYSSYVGKLFPKSKFVLMIRDGRAVVHSIISRKVTITGFNLGSYRECLTKWNTIMENMLSQCIYMGSERCLPVYYEQLVLHPEKEMRNLLTFLNVTWNDSVLHHEEYIGKEISISKVEKSSDQVIKPVNLEALQTWVGKIPEDVLRDMETIAPMLRKLGYDPTANPPNYGDADANIKENTFNIKSNKDYWNKLAQQYSIHSLNKIEDHSELFGHAVA